MEQSSRKISFLKETGRWFVWFLLTLGILVTMLVLAVSIPRYMVRENLLHSAKYLLESETEFYQLKPGDRRTEIHNYADATTLNILYSIDGENRLEEIMLSPFYSKKMDLTESVTELLVERLRYERRADTMYDRYWHGMILVLRPLFLVCSIQQIRIVFLCAMILALVFLTIMLIKRKQTLLAFFLWLSLLLVQLPMAAFCVEYFPVFMIMLLIAIAMVHWEGNRKKILSLCVVSGTCVAFFDFLTTETIAFVIPLALVYCIWDNKGTIKKSKEEILYIIHAGILWAGSYVMTYLTKWALASLVHGEERFSSALKQFAGRQGDAVVTYALDSLGDHGIAPEAVQMAGGDVLPQFLSAVMINVRLMLGLSGKITLEGLALSFVFMGLLLAAVVYLFRKPGKIGALPRVLFLLGVVPLMRMMVLNNHSIEHCFFVYRALCGTIVCFVAAVARMVNWDLLRRRKRK